MIDGIYADISCGSRKLNKLRIFFNLPDHACDTMRGLPTPIIDEYLMMHRKENISSDDIVEMIKYDFEENRYRTSLQTNVLDYLKFYIDTKTLKRPIIQRFNVHDKKLDQYRDSKFDFTELAEEIMTDIFDTRDGKIFLLTN